MANLFFIHTPIQVMIAQMIIRQEGLTNNIMLQGYIGDNRHFLDIYKLTMINDMWQGVELMPDLANWGDVSRGHISRDCKRAKCNFKKLLKITDEYGIDTILLGDMQNLSCLLAAMTFHKRGFKVCFFEEGSGHYVWNEENSVPGNWIDSMYAKLMDMTYYHPVYGVNYADIIYRKGFAIQDLPIDCRYSIIPYYHETFDKLITVNVPISKRVFDFINNETLDISNQQYRLLLTSKLYDRYDNCEKGDNFAFVETIIDYLVSVNDEIPLLIKFHPRESKYVRQQVLEQMDAHGLKYVELGKTYNIPVEYYLNSLNVIEIVHFMCSTSFYNGYLFPKTKFTSILPQYYEKCKAQGVKHLELIDVLLKQLDDPQWN